MINAEPRVWNAEACRWGRRGTARRVPKTAETGTTDSGVHERSAYMERRGGHRESARSGDADDGEGVGEGAEADNAVPRRRQQLVRGLLLRLGRLGLLELGALLGLVLLVLDLERAELVAPSKDAMVLQKGGGLELTFSSLCGQRSDTEGKRLGCMVGSLTINRGTLA